MTMQILETIIYEMAAMSAENSAVRKRSMERLKKCALPECEETTIHNGGYCCAEHCREHKRRHDNARMLKTVHGEVKK